MHARTLAISVRPPFELALAIDFLRGFSPCAGEQRIDGATLTKAWLVRGQPITATIAQTGDAALGVALASPAAIDDAALAAMRARIAAYLGAEDE
ncbi:MAG TPA: hypothetical protein VLX92_08335, partial [Kofleriaceae bacterium]|nr:hypothetical protein [Kofleriaceae bacterium]